MTSKEKWNDRYRSADDTPVSAAAVLSDNIHLLPATGKALDLACGRGGNALLLSSQGLQVSAWDVSDVVINELAQRAEAQGLNIDANVRDVETAPPHENSFDVIVVSYFLERNIMASLVNALKPGGLLFYQTFSQEKVSERGPQSKQYRLARQELLHLLKGLEVIVYREEGLTGDTRSGQRDETSYVGLKPAE